MERIKIGRAVRGGMITGLLTLVVSAAFAQTPCPSGDPENCHPGFAVCEGSPTTIVDVTDPSTGVVVATASIDRNETLVRINIRTVPPFFIVNAYAQPGHPSALPQVSGSLDVANYSAKYLGNPSNQATWLGQVNLYLSASAFAGCDHISIAIDPIRLNFFGQPGPLRPRAWGQGVQVMDGTASPYSLPLCGTCETAAGSFRTQTQGGWGSPASGNNPGSYRDAHFATAFPNGLVAGCFGGHTLTLTSAAAVKAHLPAGGPASRILTQSYVDPAAKAVKSVLSGQVVAAMLSVGFDAADPGFSASTASLASLVLASGPLQGRTVQEVIDDANRVLGGCASALGVGPNQLNEALSTINENFVDGDMDGEALSCAVACQQ